MTGGAAANGGHGGISGHGSQYDLYFDQNKLPINQHHNNSSSASNGAPEYLTMPSYSMQSWHDDAEDEGKNAADGIDSPECEDN